MHHYPLFGSTLRDYLIGAWRVTRHIDDRRGGGTARFDGESTFLAVGDGLNYAESGCLTIGGQAHDAAQTNHWTFPADDIAEVQFADGRAFHTLILDGHAATATHHCTPDDYHGTYAFKSRDEWHLTWRVIGPRKDYTSRSVYTRLHRPSQSLVSGNQR